MVDLILLDLHMPDMDGFAVLDVLQQDERLRSIPIIFLTADNNKENEIRGFEKGALDFITKPFVAEIMIKRVNRILELSHLQKDLATEVKKQTSISEERREKVERLSLQAMQTLAAAIDAKDKYTRGHSLRVAEYSKMLATRMGKSEKEQEDIYYIGLLHDVGKIGIPDEIINKTSRLTDEEFDTIKTHPVIGTTILKNISEIPNVAVGARWHHERYNGTGYPDRLAGTDIPEVARIIGVADAYDAMTSNRSYRKGLTQDIVRSEIEKGKGTQFDPEIAEYMLQIIDEDVEYQLREQVD
jgi:putative two-component system response regulator